MKKNRDILNEAFFKKMSYEEKKAKRLPQYSPVDLKKASNYAPNTVVPDAAYQVTDTDEVKRRLSGAFGVAFGNNNVRSMASRAIKEFPIIVSDSVEPETVMTIKKMVEEQYAEYINLLISNQVVNLADYSANDVQGNIAIQALDSISGSDFKRSRIADKAAKTDNIDADTLFQNIPLYNLLREQDQCLVTGEPITDALLENAIVIPSEDVESLINFIDYNADEIAILKEAKNKDRDPEDDEGKENLAKQVAKLLNQQKSNIDSEAVFKQDVYSDLNRGFMGIDDKGNEIYTKMSTGDIVIDEKRFNQAINRTVGDMLNDPANKEIRDKFEKATFLLQSRRIAGMEYYQYLTLRLGIPVSDEARRTLVTKFKISEIRKYGQGSGDPRKGDDSKRGFVITKDELKAIANNRRPVKEVVDSISNTTLKNVIAGVGSAAAGAGVAAGLASTLGIALSSIFSWAIVGAAVAGSAFILAKIARKIKEKNDFKRSNKIEGWERVEALILEMEKNQAEIRERLSQKDSEVRSYTAYSEKNPNGIFGVQDMSTDPKKEKKEKDDFEAAKRDLLTAEKDYVSAIDDTNKMIKLALAESVAAENNKTFEFFFNESDKGALYNECLLEVAEECKDDKYLKAEILSEKVLAKTTMPMTIKYVETKDKKDILATPSFMARDSYAYGSVEVDKKYLKDRRYNQPLIMTVKFKERFDDGKYSDNELTAVIGILGRIIRVPSEEMQYILKESISGNTIEGIFSAPDLDAKIEDLFEKGKISTQLKNLPQSADIWRNLEKVTALAVANKISGKRNGNISNAHIVFSQKEVDAVRTDTGVDFLKDVKKATALMRRYSAFTLMVANDIGQRMAILNDRDSISWDIVPYSALIGKDSSDQINAALTKMMRI